MMTRGSSGIDRPLRMLFEVGAVGGLEDAGLVDRFLEGDGPEAERAFGALVDRHGAMVMATCRAMLGDRHEAEDAFQATFLVLARRAGSIGRRQSVAAWLHGVACRVARKARLADARRRARERRVADASPVSARDRLPDDLAPVLHEELGRLPESYRAPVVLCYLEGLTHEQAAARLGWPVGSVKGRLARARALLRTRLARRGLAPAAGAIASTLAVGRAGAVVVPRSLIDPLCHAAASSALGPASAMVAGLVPARVVALTRGALTAMRGNALSKMMLVACPAVALAVGGVAARQGDGPTPIPSTVDPPRVAEAPAAAPPAPDYGADPLAIAPPPTTEEVPFTADGLRFEGRIEVITKEFESFSEYAIPEGFEIDSFLENTRDIEGEMSHELSQSMAAIEAELSAMSNQRKKIAEAMARTRNAFAKVRARRDALKATIAKAPPTLTGGEIDPEEIRNMQQVEQELLDDLEQKVQLIGGSVRALESHDRTYEFYIHRFSALREALAGAEVRSGPTPGDPPSATIEPPPLDPATRRTSGRPAPVDHRDVRIDALERKLDAVLEALRARDR